MKSLSLGAGLLCRSR